MPASPEVIVAIGELLQPLLETMERVELGAAAPLPAHGEPSRRRAGAGRRRDRRAAPRRSRSSTGRPISASCAIGSSRWRGRPSSSSRPSSRRRRSPEDPIDLYRALRRFARVQETLYPLAPCPRAGEPLVSRAGAARATTSWWRACAPGRCATTTCAWACSTPSNERDARGGFSLYVPEQWDGRSPMPLVVALHGGHGHGRDFLWSWLREARSRGMLVMTPTSRDRTWSIMGGEDVDAEPLREMVEIGRRALSGRPRARAADRHVGRRHLRASSAASARACRSHTWRRRAACSIRSCCRRAGSRAARGRPIYLVHGALDWMFPVATAQLRPRGPAGRRRAGSSTARSRTSPTPIRATRTRRILDWLNNS